MTDPFQVIEEALDFKPHWHGQAEKKSAALAALASLREERERLKEKADDLGEAAVREARRCDDFRKRWEEREREWALEHDRAEKAEAERDEALKAAHEAEVVGDELRRENQRLREQLERLKEALTVPR